MLQPNELSVMVSARLSNILLLHIFGDFPIAKDSAVIWKQKFVLEIVYKPENGITPCEQTWLLRESLHHTYDYS